LSSAQARSGPIQRCALSLPRGSPARSRRARAGTGAACAGRLNSGWTSIAPAGAAACGDKVSRFAAASALQALGNAQPARLCLRSGPNHAAARFRLRQVTPASSPRGCPVSRSSPQASAEKRCTKRSRAASLRQPGLTQAFGVVVPVFRVLEMQRLEVAGEGAIGGELQVVARQAAQSWQALPPDHVRRETGEWQEPGEGMRSARARLESL
jgi:hypothetical protein